MFEPKGIITAMVTPMTEDEKVNERELRFQVNRMISEGVDGIFCLGTNGEFYALSVQEKEYVMNVVIDENRGRVPVYAGTGCINTSETVSLSRKAYELGFDAVSVISPYFVGVSQNEIYDHFSDVAEAVDIPVILYNIPMRTGNNIDYKTFSRLLKYKNIVGIKDSSGNFDNTLRYIDEAGDRAAVLSGNDSLIFWTLLAGGAGAISGCANLFPELLARIYKLWQKGEIEEAKIIQNKLRPIRDVMKLGNPNSIVKRAMNLMGYNVGPARKPVTGINSEIDRELLKVLKLYK